MIQLVRLAMLMVMIAAWAVAKRLMGSFWRLVRFYHRLELMEDEGARAKCMLSLGIWESGNLIFTMLLIVSNMNLASLNSERSIYLSTQKGENGGGYIGNQLIYLGGAQVV